MLSTAKSTEASSRMGECGGEIDGEDEIDELSWGGVLEGADEGVAVEDCVSARRFARRWKRDSSPLIRFETLSSLSSTSSSVGSTGRCRTD